MKKRFALVAALAIAAWCVRTPAQQYVALNKPNADLLQAAHDGDVPRIQAALASGANVDASDIQDGRTALAIAVEAGNVEAERVLIEKGADLDAKDGFGVTPLFRSIQHCEIASMSLLLEKGANPAFSDDGGKTPLMTAAAAFKGAADATRLLLAAKVPTETKDAAGQTALMYAASAGCALCVRELLDGGANPETRANDGDTPLIDAALNSRSGDPAATMKALIERNARIEAKNHAGQSALLVAAWSGNTACVKLLLERGARPGVRDSYGFTALDYARTFKHDDTVRLLQAAKSASAQGPAK